ncbi:hypothetical protein [Acinetobacter bereziniae]|uniref:hypothetical protein n=1 Tax=Acinetobacter bereziniae TaxID=106648 RepID=UPI001FBA4F00|nr:hypothetical protein [Acinetobacter bereziniae]
MFNKKLNTYTLIIRNLSHERIGLLGGENQFQYAPNPVEWVDPLGLSPTSLGKWGESFVRTQLLNSGKYSNVISIQNSQNYGIDLVGIRKDGKFDFFEVKTNTTGKPCKLKGDQANSEDFIKSRLERALENPKAWGSSRSELNKMLNPSNMGDRRLVDVFVRNTSNGVK